MIRAGSASPVVAHGMALHAARARLAGSRRWILIDSLLLAVLLYDLWSSCGCQGAAVNVTRALESVAAGALVLALGTHAARALTHTHVPTHTLTRAQRRLLAIHTEPSCEPEQKPPPSPSPPPPEELDISLPSSVFSPRLPPSPPSSPPGSPPRPPPDSPERDTFGSTYRAPPPPAPPPYRAAPRAPPPLHTTVSQHLPQHCLNMRTWIHATIVSRVAEEIERERQAHGNNAQAHRDAHALRRYVEVSGYKAHAHYVADRIRELSQGACLGAFRWDSGGANWDNDKPTDAEIIMHLFSVYMTGAMGGAAGGTLVMRSRRPPHYDLRHHNTTIQIPGGRNNVLQCALVCVCVCRRAATHTLTHALNLHWVLDDHTTD